jgi:small subunit ribosomal protein S7
MATGSDQVHEQPDGRRQEIRRRSIVYNALERVESKLKRAPIEVFHEALDNIKPSVEVRSRRVGGATYQVPVEVRPERREALAIRWLIIAARKRNENTMEERLAGELLDAVNSAAAPSRSAKTPTRWPTPTRRSAITAGNTQA